MDRLARAGKLLGLGRGGLRVMEAFRWRSRRRFAPSASVRQLAAGVALRSGLACMVLTAALVSLRAEDAGAVAVSGACAAAEPERNDLVLAESDAPLAFQNEFLVSAAGKGGSSPKLQPLACVRADLAVRRADCSTLRRSLGRLGKTHPCAGW